MTVQRTWDELKNMSRKAAVVTGGNGFIGARVVRKLLAADWRVHAIGRRSGGVPWKDRITSALNDIQGKPVSSSFLSQLQCQECDLTRTDLGLQRSLQETFIESGLVLFNIAGNTKFVPSDPEYQRLVNVDACPNVIRSLSQSLALVVHVSTAYVAGIREGVIKEDEFNVGQEFRNSYERSKLAGELAVIKQCDKMGLPWIIVRPSIIINDTKTGRSSTFTHLNALVEVISRIQEHYGLQDGEVVSKEIRLLLDPNARPNLAPVNPIVDALLRISENPSTAGKVYNLCHPAPLSNVDIIKLLMEAFGVAGKLALSFVERVAKPVSHTEEMIMRSFKLYLPYMNDRSSFDLTNTRSAVPGYDGMFPDLDLAYVKKVIKFHRAQREQKVRKKRNPITFHGALGHDKS